MKTGRIVLYTLFYVLTSKEICITFRTVPLLNSFRVFYMIWIVLPIVHSCKNIVYIDILYLRWNLIRRVVIRHVYLLRYRYKQHVIIVKIILTCKDLLVVKLQYSLQIVIVSISLSITVILICKMYVR